MARSPALSSSPRLSVDDWVGAALELMTRHGIAGVKINRLAERLGVTKGSFYWHFRDLDALFDAIAERWGEGRDQTRDELRAVRDFEPIDRLRRSMQIFFDQRLAPLDAAMREWARSDERAQAAVEASDRYIFDYVNRAFRDMGFTAAQADLRAKTLYYTGVGFGVVGPLGRAGTEKQVRSLLELLSQS